jgi:hypothetical protein
MHLADRHCAQMNQSVDELTGVPGSPFDQRTALQFKIAIGQATLSIVGGVDPYASLFDMVSFVTITRLILEEHWVTRENGALFRPWLARTQQLETNVWQLVDQVLQTKQQEELRRAIETYYRDNPDLHRALLTRPYELASALPRTVSAQRVSSSVLSLDPFASLDPAVREVTEARLFAKRATFLLTRMPDILRWQSELLVVNSMTQPQVTRVIESSTRLSESVDRASRSAETISRTAEQLPDRISAEREAFLRALEDQTGGLQALLEGVAACSDSLTATVTNTDALMKRFGIGEPRLPRNPDRTNARPFDILDYAQTAREAAELARELDSVVSSLHTTLESPALETASSQAVSEVRRLVNHAFLLAAGLIVLVLLCALVYRASRSRPGK